VNKECLMKMQTSQTTLEPFRTLTLSRRAVLARAAVAGLTVPALATLVAPTALADRFASPLRQASEPLAESLDDVLTAVVADGIPGVVLQVDRAGETIYTGAAGVANIEQETPIKVTDRQRIYSIAKTFTSLVTLQLVDEGVFSLDDTVTKRLDDPAVLKIPNVDEVTLRQLLVHTSGIYDFADDTDSPFWSDAFLGPNADWTKVWTPEELLAYADGAKHAPYFAPGEGYHYSNTNYILIGMMIEKETGKNYGSELERRILKPLALADTFFAEGAEMPEGTIDAYQQIEDALVSLSGTNLSWAWTFGGMVSTPADLARFSRAVFDGELISAASHKEMFTFVPADKPGKFEGMGIYKIETPNGVLVGMDGTGPGANSSMMRLEADDLTVLMIDNVAPDQGTTEIRRDEVVGLVLDSE
jgi:D-alanyl-D-alanine carboxypeptidase